mgnify:CR=1 FL=1
MRYIRYAFLAALAIVLVSVALANRGMVMLQLFLVFQRALNIRHRIKVVALQGVEDGVDIFF